METAAGLQPIAHPLISFGLFVFNRGILMLIMKDWTGYLSVFLCTRLPAVSFAFCIRADVLITVHSHWACSLAVC